MKEMWQVDNRSEGEEGRGLQLLQAVTTLYRQFCMKETLSKHVPLNLLAIFQLLTE